MKTSSDSRLHTLNNYLTVLVVLIALYIMAAPILPQITWWIRHDSPVQGIVPRPRRVAISKQVQASQQDLLTIPRLDMQQPVYQGGIESLRKGVWRIPHTSTPDKGGNTVLAAHRFTYAGSGVFYHLDKVQTGDELALHWNGKIYTYKVTDIVIVPPDEVSIEAPTKSATLTLYTCTPLWNAKNRLVVQAKLTGENP